MFEMVEHKMKKKIVVGVLAGMLVLMCIVAALFFRTFMAQNVQNRDVTVVVPPGATFEQVMDTLRKHEVLKSEETFRKTAKVLKYKTMRIGKYDISDCRTNLDLVRLLRRGQHYPVKFTFNNVRTADQLVERFRIAAELLMFHAVVVFHRKLPPFILCSEPVRGFFPLRF